MLFRSHARKIFSRVVAPNNIRSVSWVASVSWETTLDPKLSAEFGNIEMLWRYSKQVYSSHPGPSIYLTRMFLIVDDLGATWFVLILFICLSHSGKKRQKMSLEVARVHRESRCGSVEGPPSHVDPVLLPPVGCGVAARLVHFSQGLFLLGVSLFLLPTAS